MTNSKNNQKNGKLKVYELLCWKIPTFVCSLSHILFILFTTLFILDVLHFVILLEFVYFFHGTSLIHCSIFVPFSHAFFRCPYRANGIDKGWWSAGGKKLRKDRDKFNSHYLCSLHSFYFLYTTSIQQQYIFPIPWGPWVKQRS